MAALPLSVAGLVVCLATWLRYLSLIPRERVPRRPVGSSVGMVVSSGVAVAALASGGSVAALALATATLLLAGFFFYLLGQGPQPDGALAVRVGDPLLPFSATDREGHVFDSTSLAGRRVLLKFFRGHW